MSPNSIINFNNNNHTGSNLNRLKQHIKQWLRKLRILKVFDYLLYILNRARHAHSNRQYLSDHPEFRPPPAHLAFDAYNHTNWREYDEAGRKHAKLIADLVREHLDTANIKICEWGCGPARVIRHLHAISHSGDISITGTDYNGETIEWCKKAYPQIRFFTNNLEPPLPFEAESFDCIYALSVFTHLSERLHKIWLEELYRVLKKNGIIIFTTHGEQAASRLLATDRNKFDTGDFVEQGRYEEGKKHFVAYHSPVYIRETLLKDYTVTDHISRPVSYYLGQEVWVIKKSAE